MLTANELDIESLSIKLLPCVRLSDRRNLPDAPGIYFVVDDRAMPVYYIGQGGSLKKRWIQHNKIEVFERYESKGVPMFIYYLEIEAEEVDRIRIETQAINHFISLMNYQTRGMLCRNIEGSSTETEQVLKSRLELIQQEHSQEISKLENELAAFRQNKKDEELSRAKAVTRLEEMAERSGRLHVWDDELDDEDKVPIIEIEASLFTWLDAAIYGPVHQRSWVGSADRLLFLVSILNRHRMKLLFNAGLITEQAYKRGIGLGSQTVLGGHSDAWTQGICISEKLCVDKEAILGLHPNGKQKKMQLQTSELFDDYGEQPKTTIC